MIYLDSAATSYLKPVCVQQAVLNAMRTMSSPGRGAYAPAMRAAEMIYDCRGIAAEMFGVEDIENIVFTSNASHSLNIAVHSLVKQGDKVLVSKKKQKLAPAEMEKVLLTKEMLEEANGETLSFSIE